MSDPAIDPRDLDDAIADIVLLLIPAVTVNDRKGTVRATLEVARRLGIQGDKMDALEELGRALL